MHQTFARLLAFMQSAFLAPRIATADVSPQAWRERVLSANLFIVTSVGSVVYCLFLVVDLVRGWQDASYWVEIPVNTVAFLALLGVAFGRRLPYNLRAGLLMAALALVAVSDKLNAGLSGIGELLLLVLVALMSIFFGAPGGLAALLIATATMAVPAWLMTTARISLPAAERFNLSGQPDAWLLTIMVLLLLSLMLIVSAATLTQGVARLYLAQSSVSEARTTTQR